MPTLLLQHLSTRAGGVLRGRVVIGRKGVCGLAIDDPAVSRVHAWIEPHNGHWIIGDTGSANGVYINGNRVDRSAALADGDEIHIGPAALTFCADDQLPRGLKLLPLQPHIASDGTGTIIECTCGAPLWAAHAQAGKTRTCGHCGAAVTIPKPRPATCSICQSRLTPHDRTHTCPDCGLVFHRSCWHENMGCSAYGCPQVNALAPHQPAPAPPVTPSVQPVFPPEAAPERTPWEYLLLTASVVGSALGMLAFGAPALLVALVALILLLRRRLQRRLVLTASLVLSILGTIGGAFMSMYWWLR